MKLYAHQQQFYNDIRDALKSGKRSICAVLGCGGGKTVIAAAIVASAVSRGNHVLYLAHRQELCEQARRTFDNWGGIDDGMCDVVMVQTATRHIDRLAEPKIIITDEAHHGYSKSYTNIYDAFPNAVKIGFTATPQRMNEGGLGKIYDVIIEGKPTKWLIENGYLSPYKYYSAPLADTSELHIKRGDYDQNETAAMMEKSKIYGNTLASWRKYADGKQTIIYCASIEASRATAERFKQDGVPAAHLDGTTPEGKRNDIVEAFRRGEMRVLCNVDLFGEGFDVPDCEAVVLLRPTASLTLYIQQSMRSMRYKPDKTAIIIDHVRNVYQHDFPDAVREWTLETRTKKSKSETSIRECPNCYATLPPAVRICPHCGYEFEPEKRETETDETVDIIDITGTEITKSTPYNDYKKCRSFSDLSKFQKAKGYKFPWVIYRAYELNIPIPSNYQYYARRVIGYNSGT